MSVAAHRELGHVSVREGRREREGAVGDRGLAAWLLSPVGRVHLLRDDDDAAVAAMDRCLDSVGAGRRLASLPSPEVLRAELQMRAGDVEGALDSTRMLAREIDNPLLDELLGAHTAVAEAAPTHRDRGAS